MARKPIHFQTWPGLQAYGEIHAVMKTHAEMANAQQQLWLLQHAPVYTLGKNGKPHHLLQPDPAIPLEASDRGGQITYHGPGQWVLYPLLDLKHYGLSVRTYVELLEETVILLLRCYHIHGARKAGAPGVYVNGAKIAALGIRVRNNRCYHGLALNVAMDLQPFARINPCGYANLPVTQMRDHMPGPCHMEAIGQKLADTFLETLAKARITTKDTA